VLPLCTCSKNCRPLGQHQPRAWPDTIRKWRFISDHIDLQLGAGGHGDVGEYIQFSSCILAIIQLAPCNKFVQFHGAAASETSHRIKFVGLLSLVFPSIACTRLQPILLPSTSVCSPDYSCMQTCGETQQHVQWYITRVLSIIFDLLNFATVIWKHSCFTHWSKNMVTTWFTTWANSKSRNATIEQKKEWSLGIQYIEFYEIEYFGRRRP